MKGVRNLDEKINREPLTGAEIEELRRLASLRPLMPFDRRFLVGKNTETVNIARIVATLDELSRDGGQAEPGRVMDAAAVRQRLDERRREWGADQYQYEYPTMSAVEDLNEANEDIEALLSHVAAVEEENASLHKQAIGCAGLSLSVRADAPITPLMTHGEYDEVVRSHTPGRSFYREMREAAERNVAAETDALRQRISELEQTVAELESAWHAKTLRRKDEIIAKQEIENGRLREQLMRLGNFKNNS